MDKQFRLVCLGAVMAEKNPKLIKFDWEKLYCSKNAPKAIKALVEYKNEIIETNKETEESLKRIDQKNKNL